MSTLKKKILLLLSLTTLLSSFLTAQEEDTLAFEVHARLLVQNRQTASDELARWAESRGGYFTRKTDEIIDFRVPDEQIVSLVSYLEEISLEVVEYSQSTSDLREQLLSSRSALEAREEILAKNISYIDSSDVEGTLTLEKEIRRLMNEIDSYRGRLRRMQNDRQFARVEVLLTFQSQSIPDSRPSRFDWINQVDFYSFMNSSILTPRSGWGGPEITLPEGFALVDDKPRFLAVSPEGVRIRVSRRENYPQQSRDFWKDALFTNMEDRGYISLDSSSSINLGGEDFAVRWWGVPYGNEDYSYITGLRLSKGKIEVLEIAGPAVFVKEYFQNH